MNRVFFDEKEYFKISSLQANHDIERNMALKVVRIEAIAFQETLKDFLIELNKRGNMLARVDIDGKTYIENYINQDSFSYQDSADGGTEINMIIFDRFFGLKYSDIILTKPEGNLNSFLNNILKELGYFDDNRIKRYKREINASTSFVLNGGGVKEQVLKSFTRKDINYKTAVELVGEALSLSNLLLISNGYDTLTLEKPNPYFNIDDDLGQFTSDSFANFSLFRNSLGSNISHAEKINDDMNNPNPSKKIILNSRPSKNDADVKTKDSNTSVVVNYKSGLPHIQKIKRLSVQATYQEIAESIDFQFAGIRARSNSFRYRVPNIYNDNQKNFFVPNSPIFVVDEKYGIQEVMSTLQVSFIISADNGSETILVVTTQEAFENNASIKQKRNLMKQ